MASSAEVLFTGDEGEDLRASAIKQLAINDTRRYHLGLPGIEAYVHPFVPGEFIVLGAREGHGKTSLLERILLANSDRYKCAFASLDMPPRLIQDRLLLKFMLTSLDDVRASRAGMAQEYYDALELLDERDLLIWKPPSAKRGIKSILQWAEDISADILAIDYTRLLRGWKAGFDAQDIVNYVADWAESRRITTFMLTQLKDEAVERRPHNGHIQDTPQLSQRASRVILLWRPFLSKGGSRDNVAEIIFTKNREGPTGRLHAGWIGQTLDYYELNEREEKILTTCCRKK